MFVAGCGRVFEGSVAEMSAGLQRLASCDGKVIPTHHC